MSLSPGTVIGPYEVLDLIGAGGMGEVYRARDSRLHREVALKILPELFTTDPERLARFSREAQLLASLNHPHIGAIYGVERAGTTDFLVLEFIDGGTLADLIARGALPIDDALDIARQIADALEAAHARGIVHRDLKPSNIGLTRGGDVKVLDFGLAKPTEVMADRSAALSPTFTATQTGVVLGTAAYMAPEQAKAQTVDKRTDVWAFGCVLYEMLTGRRAFAGEDISETLAAVLKLTPDWTALPRDVPQSVRLLVQRCLEKDRRKRVGDASTATFLLDDFPLRDAPPRSPLRWVTALAAILAALATVLIAAHWFVTREQPQRVVTRLDLATPPTDDPTMFALSPDGRQIVFTAKAPDDSPRLWIRAFDRSSARPISGTEDGGQAFWSPDGRSVGFFAAGRLKRIDLATGLVQSLASAPTPRGGTWSRSDVIVFAPNTTTGLMRVSASGGSASPVTEKLATQYSHRWPQFLPDGRRFLYSAPLGQRESRGLYMASIDGGPPKRLLTGEEIADNAPVYAAPGILLTVAHGVLLARRFNPEHPEIKSEWEPIAEGVDWDNAMFHGAVSVSAAGVLAHRAAYFERRQLTWIDRSGRVTGRAGAPDDAGMAFPSLSPDGQRVAVSRSVDGNQDIWTLDVSRGTLSRVTADPNNDLSPLWSPDGKQIAFRSARLDTFDLFAKLMDGSGGEERRLISNSQLKSPLDWSRDGRFLLYVELDKDTGADVWALPMDGTGKPFAVVKTPFEDMDAHFSPDGRWIVYRSNESGRFEIYIRPFREPGTSQVVSTNGGFYPKWSPTGREIFYVSPDNQMMSVAVTPSADGRSMTFGAPSALWPVSFATGPFITTTGSIARAQYDIARDGRFLVITAAEGSAPPPISIILNWDALMKK